MSGELPEPSAWADRWFLDPAVCFLNHGSFGATPRAVLDAQAQLRARMEAEPVRFFTRELEPLTDTARRELAQFIGADPEGLAFVTNATTAVNTVLASLKLTSGDEIVLTDHAYGACRNAAVAWAARSGATARTVPLPFPVDDPEVIVDRVVSSIDARSRLLLLDHVTSPTGLIVPVERIVAAVEERGVPVLVDGAHAPGMVPLALDQLGASYYTGNCHKWLGAPKGAAFLSVRSDRRRAIRPLVISHGAVATRPDRSRFLLEFDWTGTDDPTAHLVIPTAIQVMGALLEGGWAALRGHNHQLAVSGRQTLCETLGITPPCPEAMLGSMASVPLPAAQASRRLGGLHGLDPLHDELFHRWHVEVPVIPWPGPPHRLLRISAQLYNSHDQYRYLASSLTSVLPGYTARGGT